MLASNVHRAVARHASIEHRNVAPLAPLPQRAHLMNAPPSPEPVLAQRVQPAALRPLNCVDPIDISAGRKTPRQKKT
jgi:hypothetical protein